MSGQDRKGKWGYSQEMGEDKNLDNLLDAVAVPRSGLKYSKSSISTTRLFSLC